MSYENQLIREMTGDPRLHDGYEPELALDQTESFCQWLDAHGDSLPLPESFTQWLDQTGDSI